MPPAVHSHAPAEETDLGNNAHFHSYFMFFIFIIFLIGISSALTNIGACPATLNIENETYNITRNLGSGATCLSVQADNITIKGNGFTLTGTGAGSGIEGNAINEITIGNLTIRGYDKGISIITSANIDIKNVNVPEAGSYNFELNFNNFVIFEENSAKDSGGSVLLNADTITQSVINDNNFGGSSAGNAVFIRQADNVRIYGNDFANAGAANVLTMRDMADTNIYGNTFTGSQRAIYLQGGHDSAVYENSISGGIAGMRLEDHAILYPLDNVTFRNNNLTGLSGMGIQMYGVGASFTNCIINGNRIYTSGTAVNVTNVRNNELYNNIFNGSISAYDNSAGNVWNTAKQAGPNILGGAYIGGNFYYQYTGSDTDGDGIGDTADYPIPGGSNIDILPLTKNEIPDCRIIPNPGIYRLNSDLTGTPNSISGVDGVNSACLIIASDNVDFDCNGHTVSHDDTPMTGGIITNGSAATSYSNITIRNCGVSDYSYNIYLHYADDSLITESTTDGGGAGLAITRSLNSNITNSESSGDSVGIYVSYSDYSGIYGNVVHDSPGEAFHLENANYLDVRRNTVYNVDSFGIGLPNDCRHGTIEDNILYNCMLGIVVGENSDDINVTSNSISGGAYGIYLYRSDRAIVSGNTVYDNSQYGLYSYQADQNELADNVLYDNGYDFYLTNPGGTTRRITMTDTVFRNAEGNSKAIIDMRDVFTGGSAYSIDFSGAGVPEGMVSFLGTVEIKTQSGSVSIDEISWKWLESDVYGYDESEFELWIQNGTWNLLSAVPDIVNNKFTLNNLVPSSFYGIFLGGASAMSGFVNLYGANITNVTDLTRWDPGISAGNLITEGGNISRANITAGARLTDNWAGFIGNISGLGIFLTDNESAASSLYLYKWNWSSADGGVICATTNGSMGYMNISGATGADIDSIWGFGSVADNGTETFNGANCSLEFGSLFIYGADYADTGQPGGFRTCAYKNAPAPAKPNMLFCAPIHQNGTLYNLQTGDYEMIVPTNSSLGATETYYFYININ